MILFPVPVADGLAYVGDTVYGTSVASAGGVITEASEDGLRFRDSQSFWEARHYQLEAWCDE